MLLLELIVEPLGDALHIKSGACTSGHICQGKRVLLVEREGNGFELLEESVPRLRRMKGVLAASQGFTRLASHPLPDLRCVAWVGEYDQLLVRGLGNLTFDLSALGVIGAPPGDRWTTRRDHAAYRCAPLA